MKTIMTCPHECKVKLDARDSHCEINGKNGVMIQSSSFVTERLRRPVGPFEYL